MKVTRSEYAVEKSKPVVYLFVRDDNGIRTIIKDDTLVPYFLVKDTEDLTKYRHSLETYKSYDGISLKKVFANLPEEVPSMRERFKNTWEADILFPTRYLIDKVNVIEPTTLRIMYLDIEVDNAGRIPDVIKAVFSVICVTLHDSLTDTYEEFVYKQDYAPGSRDDIYDNRLRTIHYFNKETDLLVKLVERIGTLGPDIITGWNLNRFDLIYLVSRMQRLRIDYTNLSPMNSVYTRDKGDVVIKGIATLDLLDAYRRFAVGIEESYKLDYIARKVTGEGKLDDSGNIRWLWQNNTDKLIEYNANDVKITKRVNDKLKLIEFMDELRRMSFCQIEDVLSASRMCDSYILKQFHNQICFPTKSHHSKTEFEGAYIHSWATGLYDNVAVFDMRSMYPSIIVSANLSLETVGTSQANDYISINGLKIKKHPKGFLPQVIEKLFQERSRYKKLALGSVVGSDEYELYNARQYAIKIILNSLYGQTAYSGSRFFDQRIAETITFMGRKLINWSREFLEGVGYKSLYSDTDSIFVSTGKTLDFDEIRLILDAVNESYSDFVKQYEIESHIFSMEFEKVYRKAFFGTAKKRYAGHCIWKGGQTVNLLEVVGFEVKRSDNAQFSRNLQKTVFDMILKQDRSKDDVLLYISGEIERVRQGKATYDEIGIPKAVNKALDEYKTETAAIRGIKYAEKVLGYQLSTKPKMLYVSKVPSNLPPTDIICFDESGQIPPGIQIDIEKMLEKLVKNKLENVFIALGWSLSDLDYYWKMKPKKEGSQPKLF